MKLSILGALFSVMMGCASVDSQGGPNAPQEAAKLSSSSRMPASFTEELALISAALERQYGERHSDFTYKASSNPLVYVGNGLMRLGKPITKINSDRIREYEVMHRISFMLDGELMDCYGGVRELRDPKGVFFVNVSACNQDFTDLLSWTNEFSTYISIDELGK